MTNIKTMLTLISALVLSLVLMFGYSIESHSELHRTDIQILEESRRYTDSRIIEIQSVTLSAISDVSKATNLLARIICQTQFDNKECERELGPIYKDK
ncbi:hypothetical protein [Pseudomonas sp. R5(2019)]|uniref:hypothetical protein n=1 Tax=Pseudomonas sp. R5(2019) TaxID=2697566 RepID=UPI0014127D83|nr:hypothetical protein [Pseudomonas sp. R5(2019)]NBA96837.1 hypothetical protein [Pseudomonas sp. R5(2019)]